MLEIAFSRTKSQKEGELRISVMSFYDIIEKDVDGVDVSFSKFRGKVVYGVNVAR
jgi:hypothetical protein